MFISFTYLIQPVKSWCYSFFFVVISMCLMASIEQQLKVCNLAEIIETICVLLRSHLSPVSCAGLDLS